jgi:hypothetical protein
MFGRLAAAAHISSRLASTALRCMQAAIRLGHIASGNLTVEAHPALLAGAPVLVSCSGEEAKQKCARRAGSVSRRAGNRQRHLFTWGSQARDEDDYKNPDDGKTGISDIAPVSALMPEIDKYDERKKPPGDAGIPDGVVCHHCILKPDSSLMPPQLPLLRQSVSSPLLEGGSLSTPPIQVIGPHITEHRTVDPAWL